MSTQQRAIAVTGASRGIGAAIALELAQRGFRVGCLSRKGTGIENLAIPAELNGRFVNVACDVTDEQSARAHAIDEFRRLEMESSVNWVRVIVEVECRPVPA